MRTKHQAEHRTKGPAGYGVRGGGRRRAGRRRVMALSAAALLLSGLALGARTHAADKEAPTGGDAPAGTAGKGARAGKDVYVASCRTSVEGSRVTAYCHNPNPGADRVQLHVECARWWDIDSDSAPVEVGPTAYAELTQRCWKEVDEAWISHRPVPDRR
ncbi:hypothetical protein [Streptomyces lavendulocolor]|uniref:hypothetical protein n=1 Tax=Streptomyces lavendulocolor TaxID=67316 RepID=UPI003C2BA1D3